jgi:O-antigen/teichoic acid export membrane protein
MGATLSVDEMGTYTLAMTAGILIASLSEFGIRNVFVRDVAQDLDKGPALLAAFSAIKILLAAILTPIALTYVALRSGSSGTWAGLTIAAGLFANSVGVAWLSLARAHERFEWDAMGQIVYSLLLVPSLAFWLHVWPRAAGAGVAQFVAATAQVVFTAIVLRRVFSLRIGTLSATQLWSSAIALIRRSLPFGLWSILALLYFRIDTIILQEMRGLHEVGVYGAAYRLFEIGTSIPVAIAGALLPRYARSVGTSSSNIAHTYVLTYRRQAWMALALGLAMIGLADPIVRIIWTERFAGSAAPLVGLGVALTCSTMYSVNGASLTAMNDGRFVAWMALGALILNVILNLFAIPRWGAVGAAWTTAATEAWLLFASTLRMRRLLPKHRLRVVGPTIAVALVVIAAGTSGSYIAGPVLAALCLLGAAVAALRMSRGLFETERALP